MQSRHFNFYGLRLAVFSEAEFILEEIKRDFSYFLSNYDAGDIKITIFHQVPYYALVPQIKASLYLSDAIAYDYRNTRYVDYNGKALSIYHYDREEGCVYSEDKNILHEISYLLILSRAGELLDKKGIHRIHGLGITFDEKGVLCLLPMGCGKTTLALELIKGRRIKLISDDTPLISNKGDLLPFPIRVGISNELDYEIPTQFLRKFHRRKYGPKTLIDIEYFNGKISGISRPYIVLIAEREFSNQAKIKRVNKIKAIFPFIRDGVMGLGLPQMVEYFLRNNLKDFNKISIILSRIFVFLRIISISKVFKFTIGQDRKRNAEVLLNLLDNELYL